MPTDWLQHSKGLQERRLDTNFCHVRLHYSADPEKDDIWARKHSVRYGGMNSPKWRREMEIDYTAVRGQPVYPMLCQTHIKHKLFDKKWAFYRVLDHGIRHPTVCLWVAVNQAGDVHVYREYYMTNKTIPFNCHEILRRSAENVIDTYIDPSTKQRIPLGSKDKAPVSILSIYNDSFGFSCCLADNSRVGYDTVRDSLLSTLARDALRSGTIEEGFAKEYFGEFCLSDTEFMSMAQKPSLTFEPSKTVRVFKEMRNLRFKEITGDPTEKAAPEEIMDFEDDGPDCVRYAVQSGLDFRICRPQKGSYLEEIRNRRYANPRRIKRYAV